MKANWSKSSLIWNNAKLSDTPIIVHDETNHYRFSGLGMKISRVKYRVALITIGTSRPSSDLNTAKGIWVAVHFPVQM